ncbi:hypothetical protein GCM10027456_69560 [Kineosporia babensis]
MNDVFLTSLLLAGIVCIMWREMLQLLVVLGATTICLAVVFMVVGIQSVTQAS